MSRNCIDSEKVRKAPFVIQKESHNVYLEIFNTMIVFIWLNEYVIYVCMH